MRTLYILLFCFITTASYSQTTKSTTIFLIRHAEKVVNGTKDPILTEAGKDRAKRWASILSSEKIDMVYSTNYIRTKSTAKPIAKANNISEVNIYDPGNLDLNEFLVEIKGKSVVVVGHSNTIPMLVNALINEERYTQIDESVYSNLYIVQYTSSKKADAVLLQIN